MKQLHVSWKMFYLVMGVLTLLGLVLLFYFDRPLLIGIMVCMWLGVAMVMSSTDHVADKAKGRLNETPPQPSPEPEEPLRRAQRTMNTENWNTNDGTESPAIGKGPPENQVW